MLKVGHHGSNTSTSYVFLRQIMPAYAIISCGKDNAYGHPHEEVLSRLADEGAAVYRTDECGDNRLPLQRSESDGQDGEGEEMDVAVGSLPLTISRRRRRRVQMVLKTQRLPLWGLEARCPLCAGSGMPKVCQRSGLKK